MTELDQVLALARLVPVFPCRSITEGRRKAKSPLTANGFLDASQDLLQIKAWFDMHPGCLWGVPMGSTTRLVAIDYDPDKATQVSQDWVAAHTGELMAARQHTTARNGRHYIFRASNGDLYHSGADVTLDGQKRPGIDIRAEGGYIIWWPLTGLHHENTAPELPAGLLEGRAFHAPHEPRPPAPTSPAEWQRSRTKVMDALAHIDPQPYDQWVRTGMSIHHASGGSDDGFDLWHGWSAGGITGDLPHSYSGVEACREKWDSFGRNRGSALALGSLFNDAKTGGYQMPVSERETELPPVAIYTLYEGEVPRGTPVDEYYQNGELVPAKEAQLKAAPPLQAVRALSGLMGMQDPMREWFFEEVIPAGAFLIVGRPKVGKSWLLFQLAIAAATCRDFLGYAALGAHGVLYISAEDDVTRIKARFLKFEVSIPLNMQVMVRDQLETFAKTYSPHYTFPQWLDAYLQANKSIKLVIIDTESTVRHMWDGENGGSQERSITRKDYAEVREMDTIALKHSVFLGLVNHTGKRKGTGQWADIHELINRTNTALAGASGSIVIADPPDHDPMESESRFRVLGIRGRDISHEHMIAIEQRPNGAFESLGKWLDHKQTQTEANILDAMIEMEEGADQPNQWVTAAEIAQFISKAPGAVRRAISRMRKKNPRLEFKGYRCETKPSQGIRVFKL